MDYQKSIKVQLRMLLKNNNLNNYVQIHAPSDLKLRPIVGGPQSVTQRLSNLLDIILKPLCDLIPSFIKDDIDFLKHLPKNVAPNTQLITFDIVNFYSNIPHELGVEAIEYWLEKGKTLIQPRFRKQFIIKSTEIILKRNAFYFD